MNIAWWLRHSAREQPEHVASIDADGTEVTYGELQESASRFAAALRHGLGVREDSVIVTLAPEGGQHLALMYATLQVGAVFAPLNPGLLPERLAQQAKTGAVELVVAAPQHASLATEIVTRTGGDAVVVTLGPNELGLPDLLAFAPSGASEPQVTSRRTSDLAVINFTAGTSGHSKGVMMTHGTLSLSAQGAMFTSALGRDTVNLSLIGLYHSGGLHDAVKFVMAGSTIVWSGGWEVERVVRLIGRHRPNWIFFIVPTMLRDLIRHPEWPTLPIEGIGMYVAGEPVPAAIAEELERRGARYTNAYGMTETMPFRITGPSFGPDGEQEPPPFGSSGKPRPEFCDVVIKDPDTGAVVQEPFVEGEICVRGDTVTPGYFNDPTRTAEAVDAEGWLHTKDVGFRDEAGWYFLRGRTDDTINSGGEKLSLIEIDNVLLAHPDVADAACVGVAHRRFGEVPAAFVVLKDLDARDDADMMARLDGYVVAETERWKRPRLYAFVDSIPRTPAKRTKSFPELRARLHGIEVSEVEGVVLLSSMESGDTQ